ncbi:MAG: hypothetical protein IPO40_12775 [Fibrobacteres bacterium]|nr:hypothetical protein [Fibrobacterota bacterium]
MPTSNEAANLWMAFQDQALRGLDQVAGWRNFLSLSIDPSFESHERLALCRVKDDCTWRYAVWDASADSKRCFQSPEAILRLKLRKIDPTYRVATGAVLAEDLHALLHSTKGLRLPVGGSSKGVGLDGTFYTISVGDPMMESIFKWWESLPEEWSPLADLHSRLLGILQRARESISGG